jgi:hypothetical protein
MWTGIRWLAFVLLMGASATQPASPAPRMSMDKVRYPDALPTRGVSSQLPLIGKMIGEVPEKAMGGAWVSISGDTERAKRLRDRLAQLKIGTSGTQFASNGGPGGATDTLIGLTDGRISRVVLVFGAKMTWSDAERKLRDFTVASVSAEGGRGMEKYWGTIEKDNAKYYGRVIGYWEDNKEAAVKKHYNSNGSVTGTRVAAEHQDGPTGIVIDVDAFSWGLANYVSPEHVDTVRNHKLATGLTETEARVAMYGKESQSTQENGVTKIKFYQPPPPDEGGIGPRKKRAQQGAGNDAAAAGGGGGGAIAGGGGGRKRGGGGGGFSPPPAQGGPNPAAQNTVAVAAHPSDGYDGEVKIPGTEFASDYKFSEDVGNVGEKATLVATAIVKDGVVTRVN